jgi:hypothetical protein
MSGSVGTSAQSKLPVLAPDYIALHIGYGSRFSVSLDRVVHRAIEELVEQLVQLQLTAAVPQYGRQKPLAGGNATDDPVSASVPAQIDAG